MNKNEIAKQGHELINHMTGGSTLFAMREHLDNGRYDDVILLSKRLPQNTAKANQNKIQLIHLMKNAIDNVFESFVEPATIDPPRTSYLFAKLDKLTSRFELQDDAKTSLTYDELINVFEIIFDNGVPFYSKDTETYLGRLMLLSSKFNSDVELVLEYPKEHPEFIFENIEMKTSMYSLENGMSAIDDVKLLY